MRKLWMLWWRGLVGWILQWIRSYMLAGVEIFEGIYLNIEFITISYFIYKARLRYYIKERLAFVKLIKYEAMYRLMTSNGGRLRIQRYSFVYENVMLVAYIAHMSQCNILVPTFCTYPFGTRSIGVFKSESFGIFVILWSNGTLFRSSSRPFINYK